MRKNRLFPVLAGLILIFGFAAAVPAASKAPVYPDGTLLMSNQAKAVYVIEKGKKVLIPDPPTFNAKKYRWDQIMKVEQAVIDSIPTGKPLPSVAPKANPKAKGKK